MGNLKILGLSVMAGLASPCRILGPAPYNVPVLLGIAVGALAVCRGVTIGVGVLVGGRESKAVLSWEIASILLKLQD
ncbi:hypothetical protein BDQ17DRAFT_880526 [Cyathus striatus]|nr:hypothetical protein BDQ17DRAFT_880526 [Cyathus striatus]